MDIEHLGEAVIGQLVDRGLVRDFADLYRLRVADVETLEGFARKSAANLVEAIALSRGRGLARLLNALGIRLVGEHVARLLARRVRTLDRLMSRSADELAAIPGIGSAIAESVVKFFADAGNRAVVRRLPAAGVRMTEATTAARGPLAGRTIVLTGALAGFTRDEAAARIEALGGRVSDAVSRRTDYVVVGDGAGTQARRRPAPRRPHARPGGVRGAAGRDPMTPLALDASHGEGGGQVLRTALALAVALGRPVTLARIRLRRAQARAPAPAPHRGPGAGRHCRRRGHRRRAWVDGARVHARAACALATGASTSVPSKAALARCRCSCSLCCCRSRAPMLRRG